MSVTKELPAETLFNRRKINVHEYYRMVEIDILNEGDRIELIEGEIIEMVPIGAGHAGTVIHLTKYLVTAFGDNAFISVQNPLRLGEYSEPLPDFTVLRPRADFYRGAHPTAADVLLLIEVANSSLAYDRRVKLPIYARYGVPEVWIANLSEHTLEAHRDPGPDGYQQAALYGPGQTACPALAPQIGIDVGQILG